MLKELIYWFIIIFNVHFINSILKKSEVTKQPETIEGIIRFYGDLNFSEKILLKNRILVYICTPFTICPKCCKGF